MARGKESGGLSGGGERTSEGGRGREAEIDRPLAFLMGTGLATEAR